MQNALERRKEILDVMNVRRHDTVCNLAFEFGVSERTIMRDLELLCIDYPIYTIQGNGGGIHMMDGSNIGRKYMSDKQEELLQRLLSGLEGDDAETLRGILRGFAVPKKGERRVQSETKKK